MSSTQQGDVGSPADQLSREDPVLADVLDQLSRLNSELLTSQRELARRNVDLAQSNDDKSHALAAVAHELRNPLQTITLVIDTLLTGRVGELSGAQKQLLEYGQRSARLMARLISDLMLTSRILAGRLSLERRPTDLCKLVTDTVARMTLQADEKSIRIDVRTNTASCMLDVDAMKIEQVVSNLVSNAIKYSDARTTVLVDFSLDPREVTISVTDAGKGIAPADQHRLFKPFETLAASGTAGELSTGLGLFIAKAIVDEHDGSIQVDTGPGGRGARFTVRLPRPHAHTSKVQINLSV